MYIAVVVVGRTFRLKMLFDASPPHITYSFSLYATHAFQTRTSNLSFNIFLFPTNNDQFVDGSLH